MWAKCSLCRNLFKKDSLVFCCCYFFLLITLLQTICHLSYKAGSPLAGQIKIPLVWSTEQTAFCFWASILVKLYLNLQMYNLSYNLNLRLRWNKTQPHGIGESEGHFPCRPPPPPPLIRAAGPPLVLEVCCWKPNKAKQTEGNCHHWYKHSNHRHTKKIRVTNICLMLSRFLHDIDEFKAAFFSLSLTKQICLKMPVLRYIFTNEYTLSGVSGWNWWQLFGILMPNIYVIILEKYVRR